MKTGAIQQVYVVFSLLFPFLKNNVGYEINTLCVCISIYAVEIITWCVIWDSISRAAANSSLLGCYAV
jgi:hypothetical protein